MPRRGLLAVVLLLLGIFLIGLLKDALRDSPRYRIGPVMARVGDLPPVLESRRERLLDGPPLLAGPRSLFDPELAQDLRRALERRPWVRRVRAIHRILPDGIRVDLTLRVPLAVVCTGAERLAVDETGHVLESDSDLGPPEHPEIRLPGRTLPFVPVDGEAFRRSDVLEALAVLRDIERVARSGERVLETLPIVEVRVGESGERRKAGSSDILLVLENGVEVTWGRSSLSPLHVFELDPREKLERLARLLRTWPGLVGIQRVDLRLHDPLVYPRTS